MNKLLYPLKVFLCGLTLAVMVFCLAVCSTALAQPRYPLQNGAVTDGAAVLSASVVSDLNKVCKELEQEVNVNLTVATVDFLDGASLQAYGAGLREQWNLGSDDLLVLLVVGEDKFGSFGGEDVNARLTPTIQQKLLSAYLETPFLQLDYDGALRAYIPALVNECAKIWNEDVDIAGLLGTASASVVPFDAEEWVQRRLEQHTETKTVYRVTDEDRDTGISLGKVLLTVFLLTIIFGKKNRRGRHDRRGCGCGCMPFSSILAALGLWKLWDKD